MKKVVSLVSAIAALGFVNSANAADMPTKGPVLKAAPMIVEPWTGIYLGVNGGWARQSHDWAFDPPVPAAVNQSFTLDRSGGVLGLHGGIQKQWGQWVLGAEFAYNWLGRDWARHNGYGVDFNSFADARVRSYWTAGGRLGWAFSPNLLAFVNGGFASGSVQTRLVNIATNVENPAFDTSVTQNGWYLGGGLEYMVWKNIILGVEYQHVDLGSGFHCLATTCGLTSTNNHDVKTTVDVARARLSYLFNWAP